MAASARRDPFLRPPPHAAAAARQGAITACGPDPAVNSSMELRIINGATMGTMTVRVEGVPGLQTWVRSVDAVPVDLYNMTGQYLKLGAGQRLGVLLCSDEPVPANGTAWVRGGGGGGGVGQAGGVRRGGGAGPNRAGATSGWPVPSAHRPAPTVPPTTSSAPDPVRAGPQRV